MTRKFSCTADCQKQIKLLESIPGNKERGGCDDGIYKRLDILVRIKRFMPIFHHLEEAKDDPLVCEFFTVQDQHKSPVSRVSF
jgi:hypothetical protein